MNKQMILHLLFAVLASCQSPQKEKVQTKNSNDYSGVLNKNQLVVKAKKLELGNTTAEAAAEFQPDTTINKKLVLENHLSSKNFYARIETVDLLERLRTSPVAMFSNASNSEYLLAYQYEGNTNHSFSCFEVGYMKDLKKVDVRKINLLSEKSFKTESGLELGLSLPDVVKLKGIYYKKATNRNDVLLTYRINDLATSPFLMKYNMPGYFMEIKIKGDEVVKILFGFDYP